jgi:hypothetical protein
MHSFELDKSNKKFRGYYKSDYLTRDILHPRQLPELFSDAIRKFLELDSRFEFLKCERCREK